MSQTATVERRPLVASLQEYARGVAGGLIFSLPLLYTMELWWVGFIANSERLLAYVVGTFILLLGYNRYAGMRRDAHKIEVVIDSIEEMGIGLVVATGILFLLGRIDLDMPVSEVVGKIVIEAMTVAIGVSVGTAQLGGGEEDEEGTQDTDGDEEEEPRFGGQLVIALCGAVLFAANVAPTEEIRQIGVEISSLRLLGLMALSLTLAALILFGIEFRGARQFTLRRQNFPVLRGAVITYVIGLLASAATLWVFGQFEDAAFFTALKMTVVLGFPAALGASAGRLLLQSS